MIRHSIGICLLLTILTVLPAQAQGQPSRASSSSPATVVVRVKKYVNVTGQTVNISDIADVTGGPPTIRERIAGLDLLETPKTTNQLTIKRDVVYYRILLAGIDSSYIRMEGPDEISIASIREEFTAAEVLAAVKEALLLRLPPESNDLTVKLTQPILHSLALPCKKADARLEVEFHAMTIPLGRLRADVTVFAGDERKQAIPVFFEARMNAKVVVAKRRLERGEDINLVNCYVDRRQVETLDNFVAPSELQEGRLATRVLMPGVPLVNGDVEAKVKKEPVLIRRQQAVKMVAKLGGLDVITSGEALQDGVAGQMIRVRNSDSKKMVLGRVLDGNHVQIEY